MGLSHTKEHCPSCLKVEPLNFDDLISESKNIKNKIHEYAITGFTDYHVGPEDIPENIEWDQTVSFVAPIEGGRVCKVYDGDTITICSKLPMPESPLYRFSVRLNGIDTPEIRGSKTTEKEIAYLARDALTKLIDGKWVTLKNVEKEKYGRLLADVYLDDLHVNKWMIDNRFAVPYDGGTKHTPKNWRRYHNSKR